MRCACKSMFEFNGNEAVEYCEEHLREVEVDGANWTITYECPVTGSKWVRDYPHSEHHGGGSPRLRRMDDDGMPLIGKSVDPYR
jgi:hypothetical protein